MEQRRLRLGDILDDYCPRERRVTNHAVVAMVDEGLVKQTRCATCDAEHVYKGGKAPRRKKSDTTGALYKEVLAGISDPEPVPATGIHAMSTQDAPDLAANADRETIEDPAPPVATAAVVAAAAEPDEPEHDEPEPADEGPVHRPLIRAQLARPEGIKLERQAPEFTIRQNSGRGGAGGFRGGGGAGGGRSNAGSNSGSRFGRGPQRAGGRDGGSNQGFGRGPGSGGGGQPRSGGPRKRSR